MRLLLEKIRKILHDRKAKQMLTRIVSTFAAVVVFITTYALVLPAITMESQADCGIPAHQHDDSCYEEVLVCGLEESEEHQHDASCYEKQLVCCMEAHTHSAACYSQASGGGDVGADGGGGSSAEDYAVVAATTEPANGSASGAGNTDAKTSGSDFNVDGSTDAIDGDVTDATVDAGAGLSSPSASEDAYVPDLESLLFDQLLTNKTGIYYFHPEEGKTIPENTADITEWTRVKDDTDLAPADMLRVYLRYTIPAGALNSTNPVARYRLPANLHLTDQQIEEINTTVNGIANQYINLDTLEILDPDQYNQYLGIEAVEGTRTPSDDINEYFAKHSDMNGQEYISATVSAENVYDTEGLYGDKDAYLGQDLIFTFTPYTVQKNQNEYDADGQPTKAGEKINGWLCVDVKMDQIDWGEPAVTTTDNLEQRESDAQILFAAEDKTLKIDEISTALHMIGQTETASEEDANNPDQTSTDGKSGEDIADGADETNGADDAVASTDPAIEINAETYPAVSFEDSIVVRAGTLSTDNESAAKDTPEETTIAVSVSAEPETFPLGTAMVLGAVDDMDTVASAVEGAVEGQTRGFHAVDISFIDPDGNEIEPLKPIKVSMTSEAIKQAVEDSSTVPVVMHVENPENPVTSVGSMVDDATAVDPATADSVDPDSVESDAAADTAGSDTDMADTASASQTDAGATSDMDPADESGMRSQNETTTSVPTATIVETSETISAENNANKEEAADTLSFDAGSFSVYAIVYTVDFHYEIDGNTYDFSIPGGGFVSLEHLVEAIGITENDTDGESEGKKEEALAESAGQTDNTDNQNEIAALDKNTTDKTNAGSDTYEESINLNSVPVSEKTKKFVANVEKVEFSSPELVWVGKSDAESTVGSLKETNNLDIRYSADLTEEQVQEINAQTVNAGDWALISVQPFTSEESLTITMNNGEKWTVKVTDAQISTHVITADGKDYIITVTYGPEAGIPDGAKLEATEILEDTDEYENMLKQSQQAINKTEDTVFEILFSRFFDVSIINIDGNEIEPKAPVSVTVQYADAIEMINAKPAVIHFADDGIEVLDAKARFDGKGNEGEINTFEYVQNSFSGIGTITEAATIADGQYFILVGTDNRQYALASDGRAVEVNYYHQTKQVTVKDGTDEKSLLWNVRNVGYGYYTFIASNGNSVTIDDNGAVSSGSANILAQWVGYDPWTAGSNGDGYNLYNAPNYWDQSTWTSLGFSDSSLSYVVGGETPAHIKLAKYSLVTAGTGQVPSTNIYTGREVNPSELDEWLMSLFDDMPVGREGYHKTAEVYDYENRIYQIDFTAQSNAQGFASNMDIAFSVDMSNSMLFPSVLKEVGTIELKQGVLESTLTKGKRYFVISDVKSTATVNVIFYDENKGKWMYEDASKYARHLSGGSNQDKEVGDNTTYIAGPAVDTGTYTLYEAEKGYIDYIDSWASVWDNPYNRLADLKQSLKMAFNSLDVMQEKYHARIRVGWNGFARDVQYDNRKSGNEQEKFDYRSGANNHGLRDLSTVDYNSILSGVTGAGKQTGGGTRPDKAFQDAESSMGWDTSGSTQKYLILITDGAPQGGDKIGGQSATPTLALGEAKKYAHQLTNNQGVNIISIGLSTERVDGANDLFTDISCNASDNGQMIYQAKDGDALKNSVIDALRILVSKAITVGTIKDTIDPAFYPVSTDGTPLKVKDKIDLNGKITTDMTKPYGVIDWDDTNKCWTVEWKEQDFVWPDEEHPHGWHGRVLVKAKENFLGGNDISTNKGQASLDVIKAKIPVKKPDGSWRFQDTSFQSLMNVTDDQLETRYMDTPHVNVDELEMTRNDTEWTVYLNTEVDPGEQMKALFNEIKVMKVVTDGTHEMVVPQGRTAQDVMVYDLVPTETGSYSYEEASSDARDKRNVDQAFFYLKDLFSMKDSLDNDFIIDNMTADQAIAKLLAGEKVEVKYQGYGHGTADKPVGKIILELKADSSAQVNNLSKHNASPVGNKIEKYILSAEYKPTPEEGSGDWYWNTGTFGTKDRGIVAEDKTKYNEHVINVFKRILTIHKTDSEGNEITDSDAGEAAFEIYQKDGRGNKINARTVTTSGGSYTWDHVVPDEDQKLPKEYWADETTYYIKELTPPKGYAKFNGEITVTLGITDTATDVPNHGDNAKVPYNWTQTASLGASGDADYVSVTGSPDILVSVKNDKSIDIVVIKTDTNGTEIPGAKFSLTKGSALQKDITVIKKGGSADESADLITVDNGVFTIPAGGVTILGLGAGEYTLTEVEAPAGYIKTIQPVQFTADRAGTVTYTNAPINPVPKVTPANNNKQYTIQNEPGAELPASGGPGTTLFYILGLLFTVFAGAGLMMTRSIA